MIILGVYLPELFSSTERGKGTSYVMSFGVIGSAFSQYLLNQLPFWCLGILLVGTLFSTILLRETLKPNDSLLLQLTI